MPGPVRPPLIPHRVGEELGGAARFVIREGECPWCRLVREEARSRSRLVWEDAATVAFAPWGSRSSFEVWIVPRDHQADFGVASDAAIRATATALRHVLGALAVTLDGPPYNLVLHTAPLRERVDATLHWHWEVHPRLREVAGLELGTGLPVNPVSPEARSRSCWSGRARRPPKPLRDRRHRGARHTRPGRLVPRLAPAAPSRFTRSRRRAPDRKSSGLLEQNDSRVAVRPHLRASRDAELAQDEARAFVETLFAKHHGEIYAYLIRMLRDPERRQTWPRTRS